MPNNSGGYFLADLQYITLENSFFRGKPTNKTDILCRSCLVIDDTFIARISGLFLAAVDRYSFWL